MSSLRTALVGLCCAAAAEACVHIPRPDAGGDASAEASPDATAMDAMAEASMDSGMDASVEASAEASVDMDAEASVEASAEASVEPTVEAGSEAGDAADARTCAMGQSLCGTSCVDTMTSAMNCGMCGRACTGGTLCSSGVCQCPMGSVDCGGTCTNIGSDRLNCGVCGNACPAGVGCMGGTCQCPAGMTTVCAGACTDTQTNALHCGTCGNACPMGQSCVAGSCRCPGASTLCGGSCVDTSSNDSHCGSCGNACMSPLRCTTGSCRCPIAGQTLCAGACVDTQVSRTNCGGCGVVCRADQVCSASACRCPVGQTECGGACVDLATNPSHCGMCGNACGVGQMCSGSFCVCPAGQNLCSGTCRDLRVDANNCGSCGNMCPSAANAAPSCAARVCELTCSMGFGNCDGANANGCETDLNASDVNCQQCGTACVTGTCSASGCRSWARRAGDSSTQSAVLIEGDAAGNVYTVLHGLGQLDLGGARVGVAGGNNVAYLVSYSPTGAFRWVQTIGPISNGGVTRVTSLAVRTTMTGTRVIVGGTLESATTIGATMISPSAMFLAEYDGAAGASTWARNVGTAGAANTANDIAIGPLGDVYVTGYFGSTLTADGQSVSAGVNGDAYLMRLDSTGRVLAIRSFGGPARDDGRSVAVDSVGNVYVGAEVSTPGTFGGVMVPAHGSEVLLSRFDRALAPAWTNPWGSVWNETVSGLAIDNLDNIIVVGEYQSSFSFGARTLASTNGGSFDVFVASIANDGTPNWATNIGCQNSDQAFGVAALPSGRIFVGGSFSGGTFVAGGMTAPAAGTFNPDLFVVEHNPTTGAPLVLSRYGGSTTDRAYLPGQVSTFGLCGATAVCIGAQTLAMNMYPTTQIGNATLQAAFVPADASSNLDALWARIER